MIAVGPSLIESMTIIDVHDPDELAADSRVSQRFPSSVNKHLYRLRNRLGSAGCRQGLLTRLCQRPVDDLSLAYVADRLGTEIEIIAGGYDRFCITTMLAGHMEIATPAAGRAQASRAVGLIYRGAVATRFLTGDANGRLNLWLPAARVETMLCSLLGRGLTQNLDFAVAIDWRKEGASLQGLIGYLTAELARPDGLASSPIALGTAVDLLVQTMLYGLPHSYSETLLADRQRASSRSISRAEEYLRAHAAEPVRMEAVATAAGCSLRALQLAFRQRRDTTPRAVLQRIRLDEARRDVLTSDTPIVEIARRWGFSSAGRFAAAYLQSFGELPSATRRS